MLSKLVNFAGTQWSQTPKIVGRQPILTKFAGLPGMAPPPLHCIFDLAAAGKPRPWTTTVAQAFWRSFVEVMRTDDGAQLAVFARRYGDPYGALERDGKTHTGDWIGLVTELGPLANAWEPEEGADNVCRIGRGIDDAEALLRYRMKDLVAQATLIAAPDGSPDFGLKTDSLAGYMWLSAASALKRRVPMRRCRVCSTWFELHRGDTLYCSGVCRIAHHQQSKKG